MHKTESGKYNSGLLTGATYSKDGEEYKIGEYAMKLYTFSDSTREIFPSVKQMEREIVAFSKKMMHGDEETTGFTTSGGSDSIANAVLAHKLWGRNVKGIH